MVNIKLSLKAAQSLDNRAIYHFGIPRILLMENAGRKVAEFVISKTRQNQMITILAGPGYNGGDGLVAARHLKLEGRKVSVFMLGNISDTKDETAMQVRILENMGIRVIEIKSASDIGKLKKVVKKTTFLIDALLGIGLKGKVREPTHDLIEYINSIPIKKIAVDIPSGLDADNGNVHGIAVKADYTVTFQGLKRGLLTSEGKSYAGRIITTKIGG